MHKERINYMITENGTFVGYSVNFPIVCEAKSLEELKIGFDELASNLVDQLLQDEPFVFVQLESFIK